MKSKNYKRRLYGRLIQQAHERTAEEQAWLEIAPVGREFGSKDYEQLLELDAHAVNR